MKKGYAIFLILIIFTAFSYFRSTRVFASFPLIPNADFTLDQDNDHIPDHWQHGEANIPDLEPSRFGWEQFPDSSSKAIWVIGGKDRAGEWYCQVSGITPSTDYILRFYAQRDIFINKVYPEVEIFGKTLLLNNHCTHGGWQIFELSFNSQDAAPATTLKFKNRFPVKFRFYKPELVPLSEIPPVLSLDDQKGLEERMKFMTSQKGFFPVGIYGASKGEDLIEIKRAGFNTVLLPPKADLISLASEMNIKSIINICPGLSDPNSLDFTIRQIADSPSLLGWYIADEPELSPFIPKTFSPLIKKLNQLDPIHPTCVAMNRSHLVDNYKMVNNLFFMDEYPVPHMPMTWFTESLDQAINTVGSQRVWGVIQAFGGSKFADSGWPRFPAYQEMRALSYLAIIHGSSGLIYFTYPEAFANQNEWQNLTGIISELRFIYPWLTIPNLTQANINLNLELLGPYQADAAGKPAIHFSVKEKDGHLLLLAVNTLDHPVEMSLDGLPKKFLFAEVLFENRKIVVKDGNLQDEFSPFETHVYSL